MSHSSGRTSERLVALLMLGVSALTPPVLIVFNSASLTFGVPTLYLYLFAVWAGLIALLALTLERHWSADSLAEAEPEAAGKGRARVAGGSADA